MKSLRSVSQFLALLVSGLFVTGCSATFAPTLEEPVQTPIGTISGTTYGGRQPIVGAKIFLFAAGTTAYGGPGIAASTNNKSVSLLTSSGGRTTQDTTTTDNTYLDYYVTTDAGGNFSVTGDYTCTSGQQVYIYSVGGNAGGGANTAASLMAVLGNCPASGTMAQQTPYVYMNEVTTVAAAYAMAGFASDAVHISTTGTALGKIGIKNAFANASQMANISTPSGPSSTTTDYGGALATTPSGSITSIVQTSGSNYTVAPTVTVAASPSGTTATATAAVSGGNLNFTITNGGSGYYVTPIVTLTGGTYTTAASASATRGSGNGTVPQKLINSIANVLAACVNSSGIGSSGACYTLAHDVCSGGGASGTCPTETATAAIYLAQHPYNAFVSTIFSQASPTSVPFTPALTTAPTTFIVELIFTGGGLQTQFQSEMSWAQNTAVDGSGNVWVASDESNSVVKFSPLGVATGYTDSTCGLTGTAVTNSLPSTIAIAVNGDVWVGIDRASKVCVLSSTGGHLASISLATPDNDGTGTDYYDGPLGIALDSSGNAWVTMDAGDDQGEGGAGSGATAGQLIEINPSTYAATSKQTGTAGGMNGPAGIAIQSPTTFGTGHTGDIWLANFAANLNSSNGYDSVFTSAGAVETFSSAGVSAGSLSYPIGVAIDSNGYVWSSDVGEGNPDGVSKTKYDGSSGTYYALSGANPANSIAVDGADRKWFG